MVTPNIPAGVYPSSSVQMAAAIGFGRWDYGWLMDETTGSLTASFTPSTPLALQFDTSTGGNAVYGTLGWLSGSDLAVTFTGSSRGSRFDGGANFNILTGSDLLFGYVGRWRSFTGSFGNVFGKIDGGFRQGWVVAGRDGTTYQFIGSGTFGFLECDVPGGTAGFRVGEWHVALGGIDYSQRVASFGIRSLDTGVTLIANTSPVPGGFITASANFYYGQTGWVGANETFDMAALYMSTGSAVASGVLVNMTQALENFARQLGGVVTGSPQFNSSVRAQVQHAPDIDSLRVSGSVMSSLISPNVSYEPYSPVIGSSSLLIQGSVTLGRGYEKSKLAATLLAQPVSNIERIPFPSVTVIDAGLTGTFESPSWTHASIGFNQAYVAVSLSSSDVENRYFNTFTSGTAPLESSPVPASATLHFSKEARLQTIMVRKSASASDTVIRSGSWVPQSFVAASGSLFSTVTGVAEDALVPGEGSSKQSSAWAPASILIPVSASGRLVDVKVWVELIQGSSSGDPYPLGNLGVAIRCPNLTWGNAHPIRNDPRLVRVYTSPGDTFSFLAGIHEGFRRMYAGTGSNVNRFYRDSFLLWEGPAIFDSTTDGNDPASGGGLDGGQFMRNYAVWQKDRGMRTVFSDGASTPNPRHLFGSPSGNFAGSPNAGVSTPRNSAFGSDVPWTSESGIRGSQTFASAGSPPKGWLNGAGGTNDVNEWPTTGVNYGTNSLRPIYPLLDSVICKKRVGNEAAPASGTSNSTVPDSYRPDLWAGFRPGLRGVEISGSWELMLVAGGSFIDNPVPNWYFRQVRLELTFETPNHTRPGRYVRRRQPRKSGVPRLVSTISGSDAALFPPLLSAAVAGWDFWLTDAYVVTDQAGEVGRSFGLGLHTGTVPADTALVYRLSGALANIVGSTPSWLLSGQGGMPAIPESSATLVPLVPEPVASLSPSDFLQPRRTLDLPQRLQDIASDQNPALNLRQLAERFVSASST